MNAMHNFMDSYYTDMRNEIGIDANFGIEEKDPPLDEVLQMIKPNVTAKNFKTYLQKSDNIHKTQKWRRISRRVYKNEEIENMKGTDTAKQFFGARKLT